MLLRYIESKKERQNILQACHVDSTAGHMGKTRTLYRIKERFMWHGMVKDVTDLVSHSLCICVSNFLLFIVNRYLHVMYARE